MTNIQHIRIYPGKLNFSVVKISPDSEHLHGKDAKENQTLVTFFTTGNLISLDMICFLDSVSYGLYCSCGDLRH